MSSRIATVLGTSLISMTSYGVYKEYTAKPYQPTPSSLCTNLLPLTQASVSGLFNNRYPSLENYNSEERELLSEGPSHVANVNKVLSERGVGICQEEFILIDSQFRMNVEPGSPLDSAYEMKISEAFHDSYKKDVKEGEILSKVFGKDSYQMEQIRLNSSNNLLGSYLHSCFNSAKSTAVFTSETMHMDDDQLISHTQQFYQKRDEHLQQIESALNGSIQEEIPKQACLSFREQMQQFRNPNQDEHTSGLQPR